LRFQEKGSLQGKTKREEISQSPNQKPDSFAIIIHESLLRSQFCGSVQLVPLSGVPSLVHRPRSQRTFLIWSLLIMVFWFRSTLGPSPPVRPFLSFFSLFVSFALLLLPSLPSPSFSRFFLYHPHCRAPLRSLSIYI
jgi:hypothetical protein